METSSYYMSHCIRNYAYEIFIATFFVSLMNSRDSTVKQIVPIFLESIEWSNLSKKEHVFVDLLREWQNEVEIANLT